MAIHLVLLGCGAALLHRGFALRRRGEARKAVLALGLLAGTTLPFAASLAVSAYFLAFVGERF
ncbi:hypothetical protein [Roseomonas sp. HF4]|uniref:hypothetical protein n=1 Tax=Roseomonas sp. HF4 TaxID=2562313 RepID=UPI0010C106AD|nr:hypothetical protein [Roseomonas sp. HF4]